MKRTTIIEAIIILYIILFLYSGISKLNEYTLFKEQISQSPLLESVSKPIALFLPWIEFLTVLLLIIPRWRLKGFYFSLILMILFTAYIIGIMMFNRELPCSCGGVLAQMSWGQHIIFNCLFISFAIVGILLEKKIKMVNLAQWEFLLENSLS
jgi:hypothetical protein